MIQHIFCVSYENSLLIARRTLLERNGYRVTTALGFKESCARCEDGGFDLLILGHSIPDSDKQRLTEKFRQTNNAPILALWRRNERVLDNANYLAFSDDSSELLRTVDVIFARESGSPENANP